jgi:hypothetical protein
MRNLSLRQNPWYKAYLWQALACLAILLCGCQAQEPPLSPAAATFKKEVKDCIAGLAAPLVEPVFRKDVAAITATLNEVEPKTIKLCRLCPFRIAVMNQLGETLAVHPPSKDKAGNFSSYALVIKAINSKQIQQQRFFLQDGSQLYIICTPLIREDKVVGLLAIAINSEEAEKRWGLTGKEFLALNFNT